MTVTTTTLVRMKMSSQFKTMQVTRVKIVRTLRPRSLELIVSDLPELKRRQQEGLTKRTTAANLRRNEKITKKI